MRVPNNRRGFSGWKLTKRPMDVGELLPQIDESVGMVAGEGPSKIGSHKMRKSKKAPRQGS